MSLLEKAIHIAVEAHKGQFDKSGKPYILHPLRMMMKFRDEQSQIVAILHDVIEDTPVTMQDIRDHGFSETIINALDCVTERDGESYDDFILRISENKLATKVKIEDIRDNMDVNRLDEIKDKDIARLKKYHKSLRILEKQ